MGTWVMTALWRATVFVVAMVAVGLPFWLTPYGEVELPTTWFIPGLLVIVPLAAGTVALGIAGLALTLGLMSGAMLAANMLRIVVETAADMTSHNLWPLELVMTAFAGLVFSLVGAGIGMLLRRLLRQFGGQ